MPFTIRCLGILIIVFSVSKISTQSLSVAQWADRQSKTSAIRWYYPRDLSEIKLPDELSSTKDFTSIENILNNSNLAIVQYTDNQYVIISSEQARTTLQEWKEIKENAREIQDAANRASRSAKIIGVKRSMASNSQLILNGTITESKNHQPVIGATISVNQGTKGAVTDEDGKYKLQLKPGLYALKIESLGMNMEEQSIMMYDHGTLDFQLSENATTLREVVVTEKTQDQNVKSLITGIEQLTTKEIKKLPSFMGEVDVLKSLITLPGVSTVGEGVGGVNVRGSTPDYNLIIEDEMMFFNPTHALGFFSLFSPDIVEDVKLYKGFMPAKYGGRISSVIQTSSKQVNKEEFHAKAGLGLLSSRVFVEGPLNKGKTGFYIGSRFSYANWLLKQVNLPDVQKSRVAFDDLELKVDHSLSSTSNIGVQVYRGQDNLTFSDIAKFGYGNEAYSIYHKKVFGTNANLTTRAIYGSYHSNLGDLKQFNPSIFSTGIHYLKLKSDLVWEKTKSTLINFGIEAIQYDVNPGKFTPDGSASQAPVRSTHSDQGIEFGMYGGLEQKLNDRLSFIVGLRLSGFAAMGPATINTYKENSLITDGIIKDSLKYNAGQIIKSYVYPEPRISFNYQLSPSGSIKLGYNRTVQYLSLISNTIAATPVDFWKLSGKYISPQRANTVSLGYYKNFANNLWETSIEGYIRTVDGILEYKDFPNLLINNHLETELLPARARAYGIELSIEKKIGAMTGRLGYTYSRSLRQTYSADKDLNINNGDWYAATYDKPNDANLLLNFNVNQRINFSTHFVYNTGRPLTVPEANYTVWNLISIPQYSERNQYRIPSYFRADAALNIFPSYRKNQLYKSSWAISVYNIFGVRNPYSVYFNQKPFQSILAYRLAILGSVFPSINYNLEF